jgi:hypothetical protein
MAGHVFISHAEEDKQKAEQVCGYLESAGFPCWIAPRDVTPGASYGKAIVAAINASAALLLLHSASSSASGFVSAEVERAVSKKVPVIPVKLDTSPLSEDIEIFVSLRQWLDASRGLLDSYLPLIAKSLVALGLTQSSPVPVGEQASRPAPAPVPPPAAGNPGTPEPAGAAPETWTEERFFAEVARRDPATAGALRRVLEFARENGLEIRWGRGKATGSFSLALAAASSKTLVSLWTEGSLTVAFGSLVGDEKARSVGQDLVDVVTKRMGLPLPPDYEKKWPSFKPQQWAGKADALVEGLRWLADKHRPGAAR